MEVTQTGVPNEEQLEKINRYTRRRFTAEEVYTFSAVLCDNEVDRDFECFPLETLQKMQPLFIGKTGILDHDHSSRGQSARVYETRVTVDKTKTTAHGEPYAQLIAEAYIPKNADTEGFIASIESGIRKEVSVGCAVAKRTCSVCGRESCGHIRGRVYDGAVCYRVLEDPTDAYEFSFVAVPAQRAAGVVKRFSRAEKRGVNLLQDVLKKLETGAERVEFSGEELFALREELKSLTVRAESGDRYRETLRERIFRMSAVAQPEMSRDLLTAITKGLSVREMEELEAVLSKSAERHMPVSPQLYNEEKTEKTPEDRAFYI